MTHSSFPSPSSCLLLSSPPEGPGLATLATVQANTLVHTQCVHILAQTQIQYLILGVHVS